MSLKKILLVAFAALVIYGGFASPCQAQKTFKRRIGLRWLGQGFSDGYHKHNPGHDTSYYNPYSEHNSSLVSQSPEYLAVLAQQANQQPTRRFFAGVPFSVYAAPSQAYSGTQVLPGQHIPGTFSPSVGSGLVEQNSADSFRGFGEDADDDDNSFRGFDNEDNEDENGDDDDKDFRDSDDEDDDIDMEDLKDEVENADDDEDSADEIGGLSGLNHSLSFGNN